MPRKTTEQKIEKLKRDLAAARAEKQKKDRRERTRRLVLLGSGVERLIETDPQSAREIVPALVRGLDEKDRPVVAATLEKLRSALSEG